MNIQESPLLGPHPVIQSRCNPALNMIADGVGGVDVPYAMHQVFLKDRQTVKQLMETVFQLEILTVTNGVPEDDLQFTPEATELKIFNSQTPTQNQGTAFLTLRLRAEMGACTIQEAAKQMMEEQAALRDRLTSLRNNHEQRLKVLDGLQVRDHHLLDVMHSSLIERHAELSHET